MRCDVFVLASWSRLAKLWSRSENSQPALGIEAGVLQGALELRRVAAQEVERLGALDHETRGHLAAVIDV